MPRRECKPEPGARRRKDGFEKTVSGPTLPLCYRGLNGCWPRSLWLFKFPKALEMMLLAEHAISNGFSRTAFVSACVWADLGANAIEKSIVFIFLSDAGGQIFVIHKPFIGKVSVYPIRTGRAAAMHFAIWKFLAPQRAADRASAYSAPIANGYICKRGGDDRLRITSGGDVSHRLQRAAKLCTSTVHFLSGQRQRSGWRRALAPIAWNALLGAYLFSGI